MYILLKKCKTQVKAVVHFGRKFSLCTINFMITATLRLSVSPHNSGISKRVMR